MIEIFEEKRTQKLLSQAADTLYLKQQNGCQETNNTAKDDKQEEKSITSGNNTENNSTSISPINKRKRISNTSGPIISKKNKELKDISCLTTDKSSVSTDVSPREGNKKLSRRNSIHSYPIETKNDNLLKFKEDIMQNDVEMEDCTQHSLATNYSLTKYEHKGYSVFKDKCGKY